MNEGYRSRARHIVGALRLGKMSADDAERALRHLCSPTALAEMLVDTVCRVPEARALFCDSEGCVDGEPALGRGTPLSGFTVDGIPLHFQEAVDEFCIPYGVFPPILCEENAAGADAAVREALQTKRDCGKLATAVVESKGLFRVFLDPQQIDARLKDMAAELGLQEVAAKHADRVREDIYRMLGD